MALEKSDNVAGIYHGDCIDGTAAAAVLLKKFPDARLFPLDRNYTEKDIVEIYEALEPGTILYIVDFALRTDAEVRTLAKKASRVVTIDHHISDTERLKKLAAEYEKFEYVFDNKRSGASLTWVYFFGAETMPRIIALVEDGDTGKFEFPEETTLSGGVLMPLMGKPKEMGAIFETPIAEILADGKKKIDFMYFLLETYMRKTDPVFLKIGTHAVPAYNVTFNVERMRSTLGHMLAEKHNGTVVLFRISGNEVGLSIRGLDGAEPSALELAQILGGGGHRNASGARVTVQKFYTMLVL